jgi:hypothetical protein
MRSKSSTYNPRANPAKWRNAKCISPFWRIGRAKRLAEPLPRVWTFRRPTGCLRPELRPRASVGAKSLNGQARMCPSATGETPILHYSVSYQGVDCVVSAVGLAAILMQPPGTPTVFCFDKARAGRLTRYEETSTLA